MASLMLTREEHTPAEIPLAGNIVTVLLSMATISVLAVCFTRRLQATRSWTSIPVTRWILFMIYIDSILFIVATAVLSHAFGSNLNQEVCTSAILLCLACYMTTKMIYYFLVEKVYIIRPKKTPRLKSKLYLFNCFGMMLPYCIVVVMNFYYRIAYLNDSGMCIIGMQKKSMMPLIIFDAGLNLYLTLLFVIPLRGLYSYQNSPNSAIRTIAWRSFVGSCATLLSSLVNLTVLMVLKGEPAWICLMLCNADVLFCVSVLHWVTSKDASTTLTSTPRDYENRSTTNGVNTSSKPGLPFSSKNQPTVVTHISASGGKAFDDEEDIGRTHWGSRNAGSSKHQDNSEYPMGKIRVQVGRAVVVERVGGTSEASTVNEDLSRVRVNLSTEDLVEKHEAQHRI